MRKFLTISAEITILHFFEDFALIALGRYTDLNIFIIILASVTFGALLAGASRQKYIKQFLSDEN